MIINVKNMKKDSSAIEKIRHSASHVLAQAVLQKFPEAKLGIGPVIENGFYYDFDLGGKTFSQDDVASIEKAMKKIISQGQKFEMYERDIDESIEYIKKKDQPYKLELALDLKKEGEKKLRFYKNTMPNGEVKKFVDLCRGPHVAHTKEIAAFALTKAAGAYWKGDEKNPMLQRIYGVAFAEKKDLDEYLERIKEAEKRDHRKLGKELDLFIFSDIVGPGMPIYTFRGALIRRCIVDYSQELQEAIGYQCVHTPNINKAELFKISGHYEKYKDDMLQVKSHYTDEEYYMKPMNCPQHTQVFASRLRSYKDLPIRIADFANLYRDEKPGELSGLSRLRCFSQDDGHSFCREDQIEEEFTRVLGAIKKAMKTYGMGYWIRLSLRDPEKPDKYIGDDSTWEKSEEILEGILKKNKVDYQKALGEAAFYGPKMDMMATDALGREWQISTIQLDFSMPKRFGLKYVDSDGSEKTPIMIHRAIVGSPERFMSILIEHYAGAFPLWLSPVQVEVIPVSEEYVPFALDLGKEMREMGIRVEVDSENETVGYKIRKAEKMKVPYMVVVGEKEVKGNDLSVRVRGKKEMMKRKKEDFLSEVAAAVGSRKLEL